MRSAHDTVSEIIALLENDNSVDLTEAAKRAVELRFEALGQSDREYLCNLPQEELEEITIGSDGVGVPPTVAEFLDWIFDGIEGCTLTQAGG
jgi:hypothetical protein